MHLVPCLNARVKMPIIAVMRDRNRFPDKGQWWVVKNLKDKQQLLQSKFFS